MMHNPLTLRTAAILATLAAAPAPSIVAATIIYDNSVPASTVQNGRTNDPDFTIFIQHADNFALSSASAFNELAWHGLYEGNSLRPDNFSLKIYPLVAGVPTLSPLFDFPITSVSRQSTGLAITGGWTVYSYEAAVPDVSLAAGSYGVSIYNNAADGIEWLWATRDSPTVNGSFMILQGDSAWRNVSGGPEFSFVLRQVPEPGGLALFCSGAVAMLGNRRRRKAGIHS